MPLAAIKAHLRLEVDDGFEDDLIEALRDVAIDMVEQYTNCRLRPSAGMVATFSTFPQLGLRLGVGPAFSLDVVDVSAEYRGLDVSPLSWRVAAGGIVEPIPGARWPLADKVTVTFSAGYPEGACPPVLLHAAKMFVGHLYRNREAVVAAGMTGELPLGFMALCDRYRVPVL